MRGSMQIPVVAACAATVLAASAAPAAASALVQLPSPLGCVNPGGTGGCGDSGPLSGARALALGPEGRTAYATQPTGSSIVVLDIDPQTGALTRRQGAVTGNGMAQVLDVAISGDGRWLVAGSAGTPPLAADTPDPDAGISLFERDPGTGTLTPRGCINQDGMLGCANGHGLGSVHAVAIDATGTDVYAASSVGGALRRGYLAALRRSGSSLTQHAGVPGCVATGSHDDCGPARAFHEPTAVALPPDGEHVYVATWSGESVAMFDRVPDDGTITQPSGTSGCIAAASVAAALPCAPADFLDVPGDPASSASQPAGLAFRDDSRLYLAERHGQTIGVLDRDPRSGALSRHPGKAGCVTSRLDLAAACTDARTTLWATQGIAAHGDTLAAGTLFNSSLTAYNTAAEGGLAPVGGSFGCIRPVASPDCAAGAGMGGGLSPIDLAFSPDGRFLYAALLNPGNGALDGAIQVFKHDTAAPSCLDRAVSTTANTMVRIALHCSDGDGDPIALSIASMPANGVVGAVDSGAQTVDFAPSPGFSGRTSFTYEATALGRRGEATVTVDVQPVPGPGGGPAAIERIGATVRPFWLAFRRYVVLRRLRISGLPEGAEVQVRCKGRGCRFKQRSIAVRKGRANASKVVRKGKLRPRARIQVRITKPGAIGKVVIYRVAKKGLPRGKIRCLPPGAAKPVAC